MKSTAHERLRRAATKAVETCPGIEAVVLFGSRARGNARPKSDWDVAILSRANAAAEKKACALLGELERVNAIVLRPEAIEENRDQAARIEAAIARQGRLLAGRWVRPQCRMEHLEMKPEDFQRDLEIAIRDVQNAVTALCDAALDNDVYVPNVVELSQQAAQATAKSVIAGHGLTPVSTHELNNLATQLESAYRGRPGGETRRLFAEAIRGLNGNARAAHGARYSGPPVEEPRRTIERLVRVQQLLTRWIRWYGEQHSDMQAPAKALGRRISTSAGRLERREGFELIAAILKSETRTWGEAGESIATGPAPVPEHDPAQDHDERNE